MYSVNLKKDWAIRGAHAAQALALRKCLRLRPGSLRAGSAARAKLLFEILRFACFKIDKA
jgi:hypothetical protein